MDEHTDWTAISAGVALGLAGIVLGSVIFSRRRSSRRRSARIRGLLERMGILSRPRHAHIGPIPVPEVAESIPEVFLRAFRQD